MVDDLCAVQRVEVEAHQLAPHPVVVPHNVPRRAPVDLIEARRARDRAWVMRHAHAEGRFVEHVRVDDVAVVAGADLSRMGHRHHVARPVRIQPPVTPVTGVELEGSRPLEPVRAGSKPQVSVLRLLAGHQDLARLVKGERRHVILVVEGDAVLQEGGCLLRRAGVSDDVVAARVTSRVSAGHPQLAIGGVELQVSGRREPVA
mmetsp:Transcript_14894/g.35045  ORF Transcript_14894/g.35045 Transcript_14894/m.35045 type:complete len:203 (-) Transcript_14894:210-818(-)